MTNQVKSKLDHLLGKMQHGVSNLAKPGTAPASGLTGQQVRSSPPLVSGQPSQPALVPSVGVSAPLRSSTSSSGSGAPLPPAQPAPKPVMPKNDLPLSQLNKPALVHRLMQMVEERFGIHPSAQVERKLVRIFNSTPESELREWMGIMQAAPPQGSEWLSLVESLTVHETYFYRDKLLMTMLQKVILPELITAKIQSRSQTIKIWSAACSTGEEPYNLSILLLECLKDLGQAEAVVGGEIRPNGGWRIEILGTDVSRQAVQTAKDATYADFEMGALRSLPPEKKVYFTPVAKTADSIPGVSYFQVKDSVRRWVNIKQHNLLSGSPPDSGFDLVICRNVMIYFEEQAKRQTQDLLHGALRQGGTLICGGTDVVYRSELYQRKSAQGGSWFIKQ